MALKASPTEQARLLDLQALDTRIRQLDHRAKSLPELKVLAGLGVEVDGLRVERLSATGAVEDARLELGRIESDVAVVEARITRDTDRLQSSTSVKDVAGLESELSGLRKRQNDLEEIELTVMERLENLEAVLREADVRVTEVEQKIAEATADKDAALRAIIDERTKAAADRSALAAQVSAELLALYQRQLDRYGAGASFLQYGTSSASGVKLNENDMQTIRAAAPDDVILCPDSSAILVRTAESGL
ncbi:zinc ribbon domain-containing protein [Lacisediminihabitans changchengi]|uniref:CT398-like coiled coil hairpin domain-containing protein n=1 Tax=Lacisediminihabitans changchengi TaxID=2787634 RepID=A0A934W2Z5_9MICO|nr:hypothetical protein [Lacisediminihabitans changchengi]MBK4346684.1 hypothetical protein [Lacisediminihabitans changchengi]